MSNMDRVITTDILINGENRPASGGRVYDLFNPARPSELVGHAASASKEDMAEAVEAAHAAFPAWAALGPEARIAKMRDIARALEAAHATGQLLTQPGLAPPDVSAPARTNR